MDYQARKANAITQETRSTRKKKMITAVIAVRFCTALFHTRWLKRPKVVILFASQSGKAEKFATTVSSRIKLLFQVQVSVDIIIKPQYLTTVFDSAIIM